MKAMMKGFFVCIEGLDKSGKTTQSILLVDALQKEGFKAHYTTEPSNGEVGRFIRRYVLDRRYRVPASVEALLFAADRADHTEREIKPLLGDGKVVVCDRYIYSSLAYQGATGLSIEWIKEINRFALKPDLAIYLNIPVEVAMQRIGKKRSVMEKLETQEKVEEVYLRFVRFGEMVSVDASRSVQEVAEEIKSLVLERLRC